MSSRHPRKHRVRPHLDDQIQIARRAAVRARVALARQPDPLPIARSRLDAELQRLAPRHHALAVARRAAILQLARSAASRTLDVELHPSAHLRHLARAVALRALAASAGGRLALARRARLLPLDLQPRHAAAHRRPEVHAHLVLQVGPRPRPARRLAPAAEDPAEDVLEASAKPAARLLLRSAAPMPAAALEVREIEPSKVERHLLPAASARPRAPPGNPPPNPPPYPPRAAASAAAGSMLSE